MALSPDDLDRGQSTTRLPNAPFAAAAVCTFGTPLVVELDSVTPAPIMLTRFDQSITLFSGSSPR